MRRARRADAAEPGPQELDEPRPEDLFTVGTASLIVKMVKFPDGTLRVLTRGLERIRIRRVTQVQPYLMAEIEVLHEVAEKGMHVEALTRNQTVKISSFGSFSVRQKGKRVGRNPKTGDKVDVLVTVDPRRSDAEAITKTILQNIEVLAAGQGTSKMQDIAKAVVGQTPANCRLSRTGAGTASRGHGR